MVTPITIKTDYSTVPAWITQASLENPKQRSAVGLPRFALTQANDNLKRPSLRLLNGCLETIWSSSSAASTDRFHQSKGGRTCP